MALGAVSNFRDLIEVVVTAISILGGAMAFCSGWEARKSIWIGASPERVAFQINLGLARGFDFGLSIALLVAIFLATS